MQYNRSMNNSFKDKCKSIAAGGVGYLDRLDGTDTWYWGMDYTSGDLYEAEELYEDGHEIRSNRLILVSYPEGEVFEPVKPEPGQYLGRPVYSGGSIFLLLVDFNEKAIRIMKCTDDMSGTDIIQELPLITVRDCYNLMLDTEPLTLVRQGHDNDFQVLWPEEGSFGIGTTESFDFRDEDRLIFSRWFEDPYYREITIIRKYPTGEITEELNYPVMRMPDGQIWSLE